MMAVHRGPKLNRDWIGLRAALRYGAENAYGTLAKDTVGTITDYGIGRRGIRFEADQCNHCNCALAVSGMRRLDFNILTPSSEWKDTRSKGRKK